MLAILVISFNILLLLLWLAIAANVPFTIIVPIVPILNILAAISYRKKELLKWKKLTITANILFGLFAVCFFFFTELSAGWILGSLMLTSTLCSLWLIKKHKTERQPEQPETAQSSENSEIDIETKIESKTESAAEYQLPAKYQPDAFAREIKKADFWEESCLWLGLAAILIAFLALSDELKDKALMEVGAWPFVWLSAGLISLALWNYFRVQSKKMNYAQRLVMLGTDKDTAKIKAAQDMPADQRIQVEYLWSQFIADNRQQIEQLDRDIKTILKEEYQTDSGVVPDLQKPKRCSPSIYYLNRISAAQAAKQIYNVVRLHDNHRDSRIADSLGVKAPSADTQRAVHQSSSPGWMIIVWGSLALAVYGMSAIFIGPVADIFIPSAMWYQVGVMSTLALIALVFHQTYQANRPSDGPRKRPKPKPLHLFVVIPLLIWGVLYFALIHGAGELYTEAFGTTERKIITVQKEEDTDKNHCVTSDEFRWFAEIYCIDKEHYQLLPEGNIPFYFSVKSSALGYVIKGYNFYENIPEGGFAPGELEYMAVLKHLTEGQLEESNKYLQLAADKGYAQAQHLIASKYLKQELPDYAAGRKWLKRATEQGHDKAPFILGLMYRDGNGVTPDLEKAIKWFRLAAERGHPKAQLLYAVNLMTGKGVEADTEEMLVWLRKSAKNYNPDAQHFLGLLYVEGEFGVEQDGSQALKWLGIAARRGNWAAQQDLGILYGQGELIPEDLIESYAWLSAASVKKTEKADRVFADVKSRLSDEMLVKAKAKADSYKRYFAVKTE
ncbi:MAG: tetratricopeptide repeat protein [Pseudomonadota bacterium]